MRCHDYGLPVVLAPRYFVMKVEDEPPPPDPDRQAAALIRESLAARGCDEVSVFERSPGKYYVKSGRTR